MTPNRTKAREPKFSEVEPNDIYFELERFVQYLAGRNSNPNNVMMNHDEIVGELLLEMAKGIVAYPNLNKDQLKAVIRRMMDNRISELRYRFYTTHRVAENKMISLSIEVNASDEEQLYPGIPECGQTPVEELVEDVGSDPSDLYDSRERVRMTREMLSPKALRVFDAVIFGNNMLATIMLLAMRRALFVFKSRNVSMKPWHVADALHMDERDVKKAMQEIKAVYAEVCNA